MTIPFESCLMVYATLGRLLPQKDRIWTPGRIVFIRPCCIGDVVMATAALAALRETFPDAHITWAVGSWSKAAISDHPALDAVLDTGPAANPCRSVSEFRSFVGLLRAGAFDLAVSLSRSPLMSLAVLLSGIPLRVGLDSAGRGFGYNLRVPVDPARREHESEIYLRVIRAIAGQDLQAYANVPVCPTAEAEIEKRLEAQSVTRPFIVAHPGGGNNPGMTMASKRYPPAQLAALLDAVAAARQATLILLGGPGDNDIASAVAEKLDQPAISWVNELTFSEIAALAAVALCYIGNDSGLTHLAAAAGAATVMMMGPSDPQRYAPYTANHLVLWKPSARATGGVHRSDASDWNWQRDGFSAHEAVARILAFLPAP